MGRVGLLLVAGAISCTTGSSEPQAEDPRIETLRARVEVLENRLDTLERRASRSRGGERAASGSRSKSRSERAAKGEGAGTPGPMVTIEIEGDAARAVLSDGERKWRLPRRVPPGEYWLLTDFGEGTLQRHSKVVLQSEDQYIDCVSETRSCEVRSTSTEP